MCPGELLLILHDPGPVPLDHPTLPVTRSSDEYFLRSTLQTLKDGGPD